MLMKKILFAVLIICILFGYVSYKSLKAQGWTFFSHTRIQEDLDGNSQTELATTAPLLFTGDIMLGRFVETLAGRKGDNLYAFASTTDYLKSHIAIANLEGPIPSVHEPTPVNGFTFSFPSSTPSVLKRGGVTAVSLANNHMFDHGRIGYEETKVALDKGSVDHFGGYSPTTDDYFETKLGTTTVIVYGITMIATGWDEAQAVKVTEKIRAQHPNAHLIAFLHWGDEYLTQNIYQQAFAHKLIDRGVDAIIGSHPHVVQGIEVYNGKPIFYSLGNFIFDQYWRDKVEDGYMVRMSSIDEYEIVPIHSERSVPSIATGSVRDQILMDIAKQSPQELRAHIITGAIQLK